jgi:hypothetical protein
MFSSVAGVPDDGQVSDVDPTWSTQDVEKLALKSHQPPRMATTHTIRKNQSTGQA